MISAMQSKKSLCLMYDLKLSNRDSKLIVEPTPANHTPHNEQDKQHCARLMLEIYEYYRYYPWLLNGKTYSVEESSYTTITSHGFTWKKTHPSFFCILKLVGKSKQFLLTFDLGSFFMDLFMRSSNRVLFSIS